MAVWLGPRQQQRIHVAVDHVLVERRTGFDRIKNVAEIVGDERDKLVPHGGADVPELAGRLIRALERGCISRIVRDQPRRHRQLFQLAVEPIDETRLHVIDLALGAFDGAFARDTARPAGQLLKAGIDREYVGVAARLVCHRTIRCAWR